MRFNVSYLRPTLIYSNPNYPGIWMTEQYHTKIQIYVMTVYVCKQKIVFFLYHQIIIRPHLIALHPFPWENWSSNQFLYLPKMCAVIHLSMQWAELHEMPLANMLGNHSFMFAWYFELTRSVAKQGLRKYYLQHLFISSVFCNLRPSLWCQCCFYQIYIFPMRHGLHGNVMWLECPPNGLSSKKFEDSAPRIFV